MATRPIFIPIREAPFVATESINFVWHPGLSKAQKQKSIEELHLNAISSGLSTNPLEVSSKSKTLLGQNLSAFNLKTQMPNGDLVSVENIYQASKVFQSGGPYRDLLTVSPVEAKQDPRLKASGELTGFQGRSTTLWPLEPKTLFYDWIYIKSLQQNPELLEKLESFNGFTDIEFNPKKSFSCQAHACALWLGLKKADQLDVIHSENDYRNLFLENFEAESRRQPDLF